jgi:hypothetical protein
MTLETEMLCPIETPVKFKSRRNLVKFVKPENQRLSSAEHV